MGEINLEDKSFIESLVGTKVVAYSVKSLCEKGLNFAGSLQSITVLVEAGVEVNIILKRIAENAPSWVYEWKLFEIEHIMYTTIAPMLEDFARSHGLPQYSLPIPKYFTGMADGKNEFLCLGDLHSLGFRTPDKNKSFSYPEMTLIMKELAKFHGVSYGLLYHKGRSILERDDLLVISSTVEKKNAAIAVLDRISFEVVVEIMENRMPHLSVRLWKLIQQYEPIMMRSAGNNQNYFRTIIHNDLWTNNVMIRYDEVTGNPEEVKFLDFQFVQEGNVFQDLMYLFFTSTTPEFRRIHLHSSLWLYFEEFERTLYSLNCPMPQGFCKGYLTDEFKECYPSAYIQRALRLAVLLGDTDDGNLETAVSEESIHKNIKEMILKSPVALARLDAITEELMELSWECE